MCFDKLYGQYDTLSLDSFAKLYRQYTDLKPLYETLMISF